MDEEGIGLVLARATELRLNIGNCIQRATINGAMRQGQEVKEAEEEGEEMERLLNICDALEALESQLSSLQAMQQNQKYERESALAEIENSRKTLLDKLRDYKGKALEVIQEARVFVSETVEEGRDLLLPPYPTRPPISLENGFPSNSKPTSLKPTPLQNGSHDPTKKNQPDSTKSPPGFRHAIASAAKAAITIAGFVAIMGFAGFGTKEKRVKFSPFRAVSSLIRPVMGRGIELGIQCPPGKVLVVEDGQARCLVKERVEVPFESAVSTPDVNYGCG